MNIFKIFNRKNKESEKTESEVEKIDYGYPDSKMQDFDFYSNALKENGIASSEIVKISLKNCDIVLRIVRKTKNTTYDIDGKLKKTETYYAYINIYKTKKGNYVLQHLLPNKYAESHLVSNSTAYPITRSDMLEAYAKALKKHSITDSSYFGFTCVNSYVSYEVFDESELKIREW